jgi:hypothetical protein
MRARHPARQACDGIMDIDIEDNDVPRVNRRRPRCCMLLGRVAISVARISRHETVVLGDSPHLVLLPQLTQLPVLARARELG